MTTKTNKTLIKTVVGILIILGLGAVVYYLLPTLISMAMSITSLAFMLLIFAGLIYLLIRFIKW